MVTKVGGFLSLDTYEAERRYKIDGNRIIRDYSDVACTVDGDYLKDEYGFDTLGVFEYGYLKLKNGNQYTGGNKMALAQAAAFDCNW